MKKINTIAIITARSGSVRIKNKNVKNFLGKPIIYYSIKILKKTKLFDKIVLSTNSEKIAKISKKYGVNHVVKRSESLSNNKAGTFVVIKDCLKKLSLQNIKPKYVCCMYPAAPITDPKNIIMAYGLLKKKKIKFIFPSTIRINSNHKNTKKLIKLKKLYKPKFKNLIQDAGQFYFSKKTTWESKNNFIKKLMKTFIINEEFSDINSYNDWKRVKKIYSENFKK